MVETQTQTEEVQTVVVIEPCNHERAVPLYWFKDQTGGKRKTLRSYGSWCPPCQRFVKRAKGVPK